MVIPGGRHVGKVIENPDETEAPKIVYCKLQSRDPGQGWPMMSEKYQVVKMQPVDICFAYQSYFQNVALLF